MWMLWHVSSHSGVVTWQTAELGLHYFTCLTWCLLLVDGADLIDAVEDAIDKSDDDRLEALLCGAVKTLRATRSKPDSALFLALMCLAKSRPTLFHSEVVTEVLPSA